MINPRIPIALCAAVAGSAAFPSSPTLLDAEAAASRLEFPLASRIARDVLSLGKSDPIETLALEGLLAELAASMGQPDTAEALFRCVLELDPAYRPHDPSPAIAAPLTRARSQLQGGILKASVDTREVAPGRLWTRVEISGDACHLARKASILTAGDSGPAIQPIPLGPAGGGWQCSDTGCPYVVAIVDIAGNQLLRLPGPTPALRTMPPSRASSEAISKAQPPAPPAAMKTPAQVEADLLARPEAVAPSTQAPPKGNRRWYAQPLVYAAAGTVGMVLGGYTALRFRQVEGTLISATNNRSAYTYDQVQAMVLERRRDHSLALGFLIGGTGLGVVAGFLW